MFKVRQGYPCGYRLRFFKFDTRGNTEVPQQTEVIKVKNKTTVQCISKRINRTQLNSNCIYPLHFACKPVISVCPLDFQESWTHVPPEKKQQHLLWNLEV